MKRFFPSTGQSRGDVTHAGSEESPGATRLQSLRGGERTLRSRRTFAVARLVAMYVVVSGAWILLSDNLVSALVGDPLLAQQVQTYKGWFFVMVTGALLGWLARRDLKGIEQAAGIVAAAIDITERKRTEAALRESEAKFRTLVEQ